MMLELLQISKTFIINNPNLVTWGVACIILFMGVLLQKAWIKEYLSERRLNKLLNNLGVKSMHNIIIPDGMDGNIFVEHLILTPHEILLLVVKRYRGLIFAADTIHKWTQVVGQKSYKFENPLHYLENDVLALSAYVKKSKVVSKVLFINGSEFPKGKPVNIISTSDLKMLQQEYAGKDISDDLLADWKRLEDLASKNDITKGDGISLDDQDTSGLNFLTLMSISVLMLIWLAWRLID